LMLMKIMYHLNQGTYSKTWVAKIWLQRTGLEESKNLTTNGDSLNDH